MDGLGWWSREIIGGARVRLSISPHIRQCDLTSSYRKPPAITQVSHDAGTSEFASV
jgi:hypothetical protein